MLSLLVALALFSSPTVDIPAQGLTTALEKLAHDSGLQIIYLSGKTESLQTRGARGALTPNEALAELLRGTGLTYRYLDDRTVTLVEAPASGTSAADSKDPAASAVTIEGLRPDLGQQVQTYVRNITRQSGDESLTRWRVPICPLVAGLPKDQGELILSRISAIALSVGAPLGPRTCRPNFYIVATAGTRSVNPIQVTYNARIEAPDGFPVLEALVADQRGIGNTLSGHSVSDTRIDFAAVTRLASVLALIDTTRAKGFEISQLADYIAMVGFTELDPGVDVGRVPTILRLFTTPVPSAPKGLSTWDESFLRSLYSTRQSFRMQRSQITRRMTRDLER